MTIENARKVASLATERERIAGAKFTRLVGTLPGPPAGSRSEVVLEIDEELARAIEARRQRELAAIDAQLRELGVEPPRDSAT
jgi:hypothetical protein